MILSIKGYTFHPELNPPDVFIGMCNPFYIGPDLHNLPNPQNYLGGTSWKNVKLEAHLKKYDEILEYDGYTYARICLWNWKIH